MNLLIVDDETITVQGMMLGINWKDCGIDEDVYVAYSARQAMEIIEQHKTDVVLCDIEMPEQNGIELLRKIREKYTYDIACIFLTCHAKFEYAQEAVRLGCKDYILKPAPYEEIAGTVKRVTNNLRLQRQQKEMQQYGNQWVHLQEKNAESEQGNHFNTKEIIQDAILYIRENLSSDLSLTNLAKRYFLNEDYLNRIFKRENGIPINRFIIQERMKMASKLLENNKLSVTTVASKVGYTNFSYFVTTYKKYFGFTPTQYRKKSGK